MLGRIARQLVQGRRDGRQWQGGGAVGKLALGEEAQVAEVAHKVHRILDAPLDDAGADVGVAGDVYAVKAQVGLLQEHGTPPAPACSTAGEAELHESQEMPVHMHFYVQLRMTSCHGDDEQQCSGNKRRGLAACTT